MSFFKKFFNRNKKEEVTPEKAVEKVEEAVVVEPAKPEPIAVKEATPVVVVPEAVAPPVKEEVAPPAPVVADTPPVVEPVKPQPTLPVVEPPVAKVEPVTPERPKATPPVAEKPILQKDTKKEDLDKSLEKTKIGFFGKLSRAVAGKSTVDDEVLDELEQILITSDVGLDTTVKIIERIEARVAKDKYLNASELNTILRNEIVQLLGENNTKNISDFSLPVGQKPQVVLVVGVNGVGKTTTIGKLAYQYKKQGLKVVLGAGDTFRAAAVDQLEIWANRVGCDFFSKGMNTDPAAVAYEAVEYAKRTNADIVIIDTAGRLHNKLHLMNELSKIKRSVEKAMPGGAPHDVLLVLDATTGQNAIEQATAFTAATDVRSLALTKLDGTAKGGVAIGISDQFKIPIKYIGVGEGIEQLQVFNKQSFVETLFGGRKL